MPRKPVWPPRLLKTKTGYYRAKCPQSGQYVSFGRDPAEAQRRYADWLTGIDRPAPIHVTPAAVSVAAVCARWLAEADLSPKEATNYQLTVRHLIETHGTLAARLFDVPALKAHRKHLLERMGPRTANSRVGRIRTIWRWAEEEKLVPPGSWKHLLALRPVKVPPRESRSVSRADLDKVCALLRQEAADMLRLQWFTGMRPGEVRLMAWDRITDGVYYPEQHKGKHRGHVRAVVLGPDAAAILERYAGRAGVLFLTRTGRAYSDEAYSRVVLRAARRAGVKLTPYSMRHSFKDRVTAEHGLDVARAALGQVSLGTTNQYGTAADLELARRILDLPEAG